MQIAECIVTTGLALASWRVSTSTGMCGWVECGHRGSELVQTDSFGLVNKWLETVVALSTFCTLAGFAAAILLFYVVSAHFCISSSFIM